MISGIITVRSVWTSRCGCASISVQDVLANIPFLCSFYFLLTTSESQFISSLYYIKAFLGVKCALSFYLGHTFS